MIVRFQVPGTPQGKGRARFGNGRTYTPATTVAYERLIGFYGQQAMGDRAIIDGPIHLVVTATFPMPASWSKKKQAQAISGIAWHTGRPDGDNILKAVGDGLNNIVWKDDSRLVVVKLTKQYGNVPGLDVMVEALACHS